MSETLTLKTATGVLLELESAAKAEGLSVEALVLRAARQRAHDLADAQGSSPKGRAGLNRRPWLRLTVCPIRTARAASRLCLATKCRSDAEHQHDPFASLF
jgi:uncharacterized protein (DUF1778 family)